MQPRWQGVLTILICQMRNVTFDELIADLDYDLMPDVLQLKEIVKTHSKLLRSKPAKKP